jgi:hypothetical protein
MSHSHSSTAIFQSVHSHELRKFSTSQVTDCQFLAKPSPALLQQWLHEDPYAVVNYTAACVYVSNANIATLTADIKNTGALLALLAVTEAGGGAVS